MNIDGIIQRINFLQNELKWYLPLDAALEKDLWDKIRLDLNFHAGKMEGIQMSFEEIQRLMLLRGEIPGKKVRDCNQVKGLDDAIAEIRNCVKEKRPLTESFIRELHKLLIKEEYYNDAITLDQKPTQKKVVPGKYKELPNWFMKGGQIYSYATPEETPGMMTDLIDWCNIQLENQEMHPLLLASEFHFRFIRIHPFDDGNGRTARLLVNYILMRSGLPPIIIKSNQKTEYINALNNGDKGNLNEFNVFMGERLIDSLNLYFKAAREGITHEEGDLEKRILVLSKKLEDNYMKTAKSNKLMVQTIQTVYAPLLIETDKRLQLLKHLFVENKWHFFEEPQPPKYGIPMIPMTWGLSQIINHFVTLATQEGRSYHQFKIMNWLSDLRFRDKKVNVEVAFKIYFYEFEYEIKVYVGMPHESGMLMRGLKDFVAAITKSDENFDSENDFNGFDYSVCRSEYGVIHAKENIIKWGEDLGHKLVDYIEGKAKLNPHKEKKLPKNKFIFQKPSN